MSRRHGKAGCIRCFGILRFAALAALATLMAPSTLARAADADVAEGPRRTPTLRVESGKLVGEDLGSVRLYRGIPYAAPPVGDLRWSPPQPAPSWRGTREALAFGAMFPQVDRRSRTDQQGEDALLLNVWAPAGARRAPVLVWFHGGAFLQNSGADPRADGRQLAERGVVVVTINYRLGALGLFAHPQLTAAAGPTEPLGNYALLDMMQSLRWVRRNIENFGGDPRNVTISGSSAGGTAILYLLGIRAADSLYDKAIVQSSGGREGVLTLAQAEEAGERLAAALLPDGPADLAGLRALPAAAFALGAERTRSLGQPVKPFVDGRLVTAPPSEIFAAGGQRRLPLMIGAANGESGGTFGDEIAVRGGFGFQLQLAEAMARHGQSVWLFHFTFVPPERPRPAAHGEIVGYSFGNLGPSAGEPARRMSAALIDYWLAFMRDGQPSSTAGPAWPAFEPAKRSVMVFGNAAIAVKAAPASLPADELRRQRRQ
jgi:para-nitrobenzyl esterase